MDLMLLTIGDSIDKVFYGFDIAVFKFFADIQNSFFTVLAKFFTAFGDEAFVIPMVILGVVLMLFKKTRKYGFALVFAIAVGTIVTNVIAKPAVLRIRPYNTLQDIDFTGRRISAQARSARLITLSQAGTPPRLLKSPFLCSLFSGRRAKRR